MLAPVEGFDQRESKLSRGPPADYDRVQLDDRLSAEKVSGVQGEVKDQLTDSPASLLLAIGSLDHAYSDDVYDQTIFGSL